MKYVVAIGFVFLFLITSTACLKNDDNVINAKKTLRPVEEFKRKVKQFWSWIQSQFGNEDTFIGRCLGGFKKLRLVMNFIIFKLGVIVTALAFLSALMFKSIGIGVILLVISSVGLVSKLSLLKQGHQHSDSGQSVHLHIHNKGGHHSDAPFEHGLPIWRDRLDRITPKDSLETQAIEDLYKRIGLSNNEISVYR